MVDDGLMFDRLGDYWRTEHADQHVTESDEREDGFGGVGYLWKVFAGGME